MTSPGLRRRLERIESALAPPGKKPGMTLIVSTPSMPDEVRIIPLNELPHRNVNGER